ncbi:MAG: type II toxin-antitoxin system RelE/ParE family toxin [Chloroflexota bacterium]|nr:type II toxin-antitoxin system RelE/ParE family toxin [Chloroflexota bacterium]
MSLHDVVMMPGARDELRTFPRAVRFEVGYALYAAQRGGKHPDAKPMQGFIGASVLEIASPHDGDTYRVIYALGVPDATTICVLHAFKKMSHQGVKTPQRHINLIRSRLATAKTMRKDHFN